MRIKSRIAIAACSAVAGILLGLVWVQVRPHGQPRDAVGTYAGPRNPRPNVPLVVRTPAVHASVSGRVWSKQHAPIAGAQVCAVCASCDPTAIDSQSCVATADDGSYSLAELRPMVYRLAASANGFSPALAEHGQPLVVDAGVVRTGLDIVLDRNGVELSGRILDATGGPIGGAKLRLVQWQTPPLVAQAETDGNGRFSAFVPAGGVTLNASADGYASAGLFRIAPSQDIELMLTPGASVHGIVVTAEDSQRPVSGAEVSATVMGYATRAALTTTAADGSFVLSGLEPANYALAASGPGFRGGAPGVLPVALAQTVRGVTIKVVRAAQVSGHVLIGSGQVPCLEGRVTLGPRPSDALLPPSLKPWTLPPDPARDARSSFHATIGAAGAVQFDALPPARYFAMVDCRGYRQRDGSTMVEVDARDVGGLVWRVEPGLGLAIRVVDQLEQPVPAAQLVLEWPERVDGPGMKMPITVDAEGEFETPASLSPGLYRLTPSAAHAGAPLAIELKQGMGRVEAVLKLRGSAAIAVAVRNTEGAPIDGLTVVAYSVGTDKQENSRPSEPAQPVAAAPKGAGVYRAGPMAPGHYRIEITDGFNPPIEADAASDRGPVLEVVAGRTTQIGVTLARKAQISGRVVDAKGRPVPNAWVSVANETALAKLGDAARRLMAPARRVLTEANGRFVLTGLDPDGAYSVRGEEPDGSASGALRAVRTGAEITLTLAARGAVPGTASETDGTPIPSMADGRATVLGM